MAERFGEKTAENGTKIDVPLRHQDIASSISATRETTSRTLSELERKGLYHERTVSYNHMRPPHSKTSSNNTCKLLPVQHNIFKYSNNVFVRRQALSS
jgi:DNA-binding HxlR family transcriptional regulator